MVVFTRHHLDLTSNERDLPLPTLTHTEPTLSQKNKRIKQKARPFNNQPQKELDVKVFFLPVERLPGNA
jgi:hypothetical protein